MKRMYSLKQLEEIIKKNSDKLYLHQLSGEYTNANGDSINIDGLIFISTKAEPFSNSGMFVNIISAFGVIENTDTEDQYNVIAYDWYSGRLIYNIDGTSSCECDHEDAWDITQDIVTPL